MTESSNNSLSFQIASAVRGSAALRDDIADEINDHLTCKVDEQSCTDRSEAETKAIKSFGDPKEVARELRHIHLGDRIMFQKIMVVA